MPLPLIVRLLSLPFCSILLTSDTKYVSNLSFFFSNFVLGKISVENWGALDLDLHWPAFVRFWVAPTLCAVYPAQNLSRLATANLHGDQTRFQPTDSNGFNKSNTGQEPMYSFL
jgi:hypothetical protein